MTQHLKYSAAPCLPSRPCLREYFFLIRSERIAYFRFILEGYDGLAILTTLDQRKGLVKVLVPDSRVGEFWSLMGDLGSSPHFSQAICCKA